MTKIKGGMTKNKKRYDTPQLLLFVILNTRNMEKETQTLQKS